jgi:hypothetical protein
MLDEARIPQVVEAGSKSLDELSAELYLAQQQGTSIRGDPPAIEGTNYLSVPKVLKT